MTLKALAPNELSNFLVYDTIFAFGNNSGLGGGGSHTNAYNDKYTSSSLLEIDASTTAWPEQPPSSSGRKKRRRRPRTCKNKEEAESQRMTHIAVERNRRRLMNEHLAMLRSLMPESYVQRGDQASIVGGAIDFVKELEQLLQSLEAQKRILQHQHQQNQQRENGSEGGNANSPPFSQFFTYPQYMWCHAPREYTPENHRLHASVADIEVTLIETHTNVRILSSKRPGQLLKMVAGLQALELTILHVNVTTLEPMVLYSISAKLEEGCNLTSVDDIAGAVHHMLSLFEAEASALS